MWGRRARMREPKRKEQGIRFWETYGACVVTLRNAQECQWPDLRVQLDLSLKGSVESTYGDIFPSKAFLAQRDAPLDRFSNANGSARGGRVSRFDPRVTPLHLPTQWQGALPRPTLGPCWVGPSHLAGGISRGGEWLMGWWMAGV